MSQHGLSHARLPARWRAQLAWSLALTLPAALALFFSSPHARAADAGVESAGLAAAVGEAQRSAEATAQASPDAAMDEVANALQDYLRRQGAAENGVANRAGVSVHFAKGQATAAVPPGSAAFTDARALAFEQAYQRALGELALARDRRITSLVTTSMMQDTSHAAEFQEACRPSASQALVRKMAEVVHAGLDAALRQLDVSEQDIAPAPREGFRCENPQFVDAIGTGTRTTALESMRGVRIVKSVAVGGEVGVVVAVSPNFVAAAQAMARGETARQPLATVAEEVGAQYAGIAPAALIGEYGTRLARLSNGETAVLAFGQAGAQVVPGDVPAIRSGKRRAAQSAALRVAEAQLAQYSQVTTYFVSEEKRRARTAQTLVTVDGVAGQEQAASVGRKLTEDIRSAAQLRLQGATVVRRWSVADPDSGGLVEGVVLAWSPSLAGAIRDAGRAPASAAPGGARPASGTASVRRESADRKEDW